MTIVATSLLKVRLVESLTPQHFNINTPFLFLFFHFAVNSRIWFLDCQVKFEFSHKGFFKDRDDTNRIDKVHMLNINECACACYDDPICVAYVFYSNNECYFYQTVTETDADSNAEAYIKKNEGKWYLLFNIVLLKIT